MRTLSSLGQRDGARMDRIIRALQSSKEWVRSDVLAEGAGISRCRVAGFVRMLRAEGFRIEYGQRYCYHGRCGFRRMEGHYKMASQLSRSC